MEIGRIQSNTFQRKPKVVINKASKQFSLLSSQEVGDKGQMNVELVVDAVALEPDIDGNEIKRITLSIIKAKPIKTTEKRIL